MSLRKLNSLFFIAALVFAAVSCKDEETSTSLPTLTGTLEADVPEFMTPGQAVYITASGVTHPDGDAIGYCWKVTPTMSSFDTLDVFEFIPTDTLQTVTVYCYAFAEGYSTSTASYTSTIVKGGIDGSIQGLQIKATDPSVTVDGKTYYYTKIGDREWFRNNVMNPAYGAAFRNSSVMSDVFGRFYNYEEALKVCPEGWRLPTDEDWVALATACGGKGTGEKYGTVSGVAAELMADATFNDVTLWEYWPAVGDITNASGMAMVPAGFVNLGEQRQDGKYPHAIFFGVYEYATFWTADATADDADKAYYRYLVSNQSFMTAGKGDKKSFGANVRCVRDAK